MAGRRQARVRDGQAHVQEGQDREQLGQEDGHKHEHEFGGSGARFGRLRRRRGVPGDALVQMTIKTGACDARGEGDFSFKVSGLEKAGKQTRPEDSDLPARKRKCSHSN